MGQRIDDSDNLLQTLRVERGLTQREAAELVGVSRAMWSAWELGERSMRVRQLTAIQEGFRLSDRKVAQIRRWLSEREAARG